MTNPSIGIGSQLTVRDGRYKGKQVEVLEVKDSSARCKFIGLDEKETKMQQGGHDFEPTWFNLDVLEVSSSTPSPAQTEQA